jgi:hypothetical protein
LHVEYVSAASCGFFENIGAAEGLFIDFVSSIQERNPLPDLVKFQTFKHICTPFMPEWRNW